MSPLYPQMQLDISWSSVGLQVIRDHFPWYAATCPSTLAILNTPSTHGLQHRGFRICNNIRESFLLVFMHPVPYFLEHFSHNPNCSRDSPEPSAFFQHIALCKSELERPSGRNPMRLDQALKVCSQNPLLLMEVFPLTSVGLPTFICTVGTSTCAIIAQ